MATRRSPKKEPASRADRDWKFVEHVAARIEAALDLTADVKVNVWLPDRENGEDCQCDVVIHSGPEHQRTRTIVEVQDRNERVKPNDFRGWLVKMECVNAQHLVCVSRKDFPKSIIKKAAFRGPSVRLATLKEVEEKSWPTFGIGRMTFRIRDMEPVTAVHMVTADGGPVPPSRGNPDATEFALPDGELLSLKDIATRALQFNPEIDSLPLGRHTLNVVPTLLLKFLPQPGVGLVRIRFPLTVVSREVSPAMSFIEYRHAGAADPLAWISTATATPEEIGQDLQLQIVFRPSEDGRLMPVPETFTVVGLTPGHNMTLAIGDDRLMLVSKRLK